MQINSSVSAEKTKTSDQLDPLAGFRKKFLFPSFQDQPVVYLTGNSLGLQPVAARQYFLDELDDWAKWGVEGHVHARNPWVSYHEMYSDLLAPLVGAKSSEVVAMGSLTANLHFLMVSFYRPKGKRFKILCEQKSFPSDLYALRSQARLHGFNPEEAIVEIAPEEGSALISQEAVLEKIHALKDELAMVMIGGVNYFSGQVFDMKAITAAAHEVGATVGFDLAHAIGNIKLDLHAWDVDFAAWCSYKYLNAGPGAVGGYFIHERFHREKDIPRLEGWWGTNKKNRFLMKPEFEPIPTAEAWQHSNAPVFNMIALRASLEIFHEAGMENVLEKSRKLTAHTEACIGQLNERLGRNAITILTPSDPAERGCQLSLVLHERAKEIYPQLQAHGVIADWREPDVIRIAPVPLYNSFEDVYRFSQILENLIR